MGVGGFVVGSSVTEVLAEVDLGFTEWTELGHTFSELFLEVSRGGLVGTVTGLNVEMGSGLLADCLGLGKAALLDVEAASGTVGFLGLVGFDGWAVLEEARKIMPVAVNSTFKTKNFQTFVFYSKPFSPDFHAWNKRFLKVNFHR